MKLSALTPHKRRPPVAAPDPGAPTPSRGTWRSWIPADVVRGVWNDLRAHPGLFLVSLGLAMILWFTINVTERDAERVVELPVTVRRLPTGLIVPDLPTKPVAFTLRGPRTILDNVDEHKTRVSLDLGNAMPGDQRIELGVHLVRPELPRRLKVLRIEPQRVKVRVDRLVRRTLPVRAELAGMPPLGYNLTESQVMPASVEVSGPAGKVDDLHDVGTEPIDLRVLAVSGSAVKIEQSVLLGWAGHFVSFNPDHVNVTLHLEEAHVVREFRKVDVQIRNLGPSLRAQLVPPTIDLSIRGPQRLLHNFALDPAAVTVDAAGLPAGRHKLAAHVELPPAFEIVRQSPEVHVLQLQPIQGGRH